MPAVFGQVTITPNKDVKTGSPTAQLPEFEVASVKPSDRRGTRGIGFFTYPGGKIIVSQFTLKLLIMYAFDVRPFQISGGPTWIDDDRYDIIARPPASSKSSTANPASPKAPPSDEQRQMLQTLLVNRFQLKFHRVTKEGAVYLLVKDNKRLKLQDSSDRDHFPWAGSIEGGAIDGDGIAGKNISMPLLAKRLRSYLERPVLDQTALKGSFDFKFEYSSNDPNPDVISSIFTSIQGIGLKLKAAKGPVEIIVLDHAEKPSEN